MPGSPRINIYTQIGLVTLIGLISKHGILMVDFANKLQEEQGYSRREAIEHAAAIRLRPILMTTAAMVVAMVPLLIAQGAGAASRFDIGVVIAAGMTIGTLFTLFVTPAVYTYPRQGPPEGQGRGPRRLCRGAAAGERRRGSVAKRWPRLRPARSGAPERCSRARGAGAGGGANYRRGRSPSAPRLAASSARGQERQNWRRKAAPADAPAAE